MNSAHSYSEGAEVPEDNKKIRIVAKAMIEARNEAIDECIEAIQIAVYRKTVNTDIVKTVDLCVSVLESLKNKPI